MRRIFALFLLTCASLPAQARCTAQLIAGPVKVRPYGSVAAPKASSLLCARNEYCSFQVVVTASGEDCTGVDVFVSDFVRGNERIGANAVTVYREGFLHVFYRSSAQGDVGEWPDPLIPKVDPEYGEARNAFPVDVRRISPVYKRYPARGGNTLPGGRGTGQAVSSGSYSGGEAKRYIVQIVRGGKLGEAAFRWWSQPGAVLPSAELTTSAQPVELKQGVQVAFRGAGKSNDFLAGDEFWMHAGPERHQPVWVDVLIPADAATGSYRGEVTVTAAQVAGPLRLPLEIEVLPFSIPSTSTLASTFGTYWPGIYAAHYGQGVAPQGAQGEKQSAELALAYAHAGLRNGMTISFANEFAPTYEFAPDGAVSRADYSRFDRVTASLMDGVGTPRGARWTSLRLPAFSRLSENQQASAIRDFARYARERGWQDRLFDYTFDEPRTAEHFALLVRRARTMQRAAPSVPRLVTIDLKKELYGIVTRWCPVVTSLEPKSPTPLEWWKNSGRPRREDYDTRLKAGDTLWWYQACTSHGCGGTGQSPQHDKWPSYMVDISGAANRVFGLHSAVTYNVSGVLYWDVAYAHSRFAFVAEGGLDPWESIYYFGGNGDGSLFYPGRPAQIGGTRHIPIESLRLKMIRDSFTDANYAALLRQLGEEEFLRAEVSRLVQDAQHWNVDPQAWLDLRQNLARRLAQRSAPARVQ